MADGNPLLAYIPMRLLELLRKDPAPHPSPPWEERFTGAVLFLDVSGFTPLSEVLTRAGASGAEYLTDILNRSYQWLVDAVETADGFVAHFSGDAITAVLPGASEAQAFQAAVHVGLDLIRTAYRHPPEVVGGVDFPLRVKVGISTGSIFAAAVGSAAGELRYLVAGPPVEEAARASSLCGPMELLVPPNCVPYLPPDVTTLEGPQGHTVVLPALLRKLPGPVPIRRSRTLHPEDIPSDERMARFVPRVIYERIELGLSELVAEHRMVTVLFARFHGLEFAEPASGVALQEFMTAVFDQVQAHGGTVDKLEQADKGSLIMALFGAPRALERAEEAALSCALALQDLFDEEDAYHITRIGINAGLVYAGGLGSRWRYDYTVMGDAVNVASRLMSQAAPREILVSDRVQARAPDWEYGPPRELQLKGRAGSTKAFPLQGPPRAGGLSDLLVSPPEAKDGELIGREAELYRLGEVVQRLRKGQSGLVVIEGEMGLGKTRLAEQMIEQVLAFGRVLNQPFRPLVGIPYGHWQGPLAELLHLEMPGAEERLKQLVMDIDPAFLPWLSLFNPLLGLTLSVSEVAANADTTLREHHLQEMICGLVIGQTAWAPLLLVLENFQDADHASISLLRRLIRELPGHPLVILVVARVAPVLVSEGVAGYLHLTLAPLDKPRVQMLLRKRVGPEIPEALYEMVWEKSQGNPLFVDELVHTLQQAGRVRRSQPKLLLNDSGLPVLPDTLRSLLQSRIDELPEASRAVAKVAAVIGTRFTLPTLASAFREGLELRVLQSQLEMLINARILQSTQTPTGIVYEFRHILSQEVIYSTLTQGQQEELHRRIGEYLEVSEGRVSPGVLAHHFELGKDYTKAIKYHIAAAWQAMNTFANQQIIHGYERALALADEQWLPLPENVSRAKVLESLGDVYFRIGAYRKAESLFRKVRGIAADWLSVVRCLRKEGEARCRADDIANALRCLGEALLLLRARRDYTVWGLLILLFFHLLRDWWRQPGSRPPASLSEAERARHEEMDLVYMVQATAHFFDGNRQVIGSVFRMAEVALRLGEAPRAARAYAAISMLYANLTLFRPARRYAEAALAWLAREPDEAIQMRMRGTATYSLVGACARLATDWQRAEEMQLRALSIGQASGDAWEESVALMNLASMWRIRGYHHRSIELHRRLIRVSSSQEPSMYQTEALVADGFCLSELGRFDEGSAQLERALTQPFLQLRSRVRAIAFRGWNRYLRGKLRPAVQDLEESYRQIRSEGLLGELVVEVLTLRAEVLIVSEGASRAATRALRQAKRMAVRYPAYRGTEVFLRGLLEWKLGRSNRATKLFAQSAVLHEAADRGREAARALLWQASALKSQPNSQVLCSNLRTEAARLLKERGLSDKPPGGPTAEA